MKRPIDIAPLPYPTYPGGKNGDGVYQTIINHIPKHWTFVSLFLGGGYIFARKLPAYKNILNDIDPEVCAAWSSYPQVGFSEMDKVQLFNKNWKDLLTDIILPDIHLNTSSTFIFLDPPYPEVVRSQKRPLYKHEMMTLEEHEELLDFIKCKEFKPMVMLCSYPNELYDFELKGWSTHTYTGRTRQGNKKEKLWMNYDISTRPLHDYSYIGQDYRERDRIKQKRRRWVNGLKKMEPREREAILSDIKTEFL